MDQTRADIRLKNVQASGEPWKTIVAVVTGLAAVFTAIGYWFGNHH